MTFGCGIHFKIILICLDNDENALNNGFTILAAAQRTLINLVKINRVSP